MIALWRERTFQSLALTALLLVLWLLGGEMIATGVFGQAWAGLSAEHWATALSAPASDFCGDATSGAYCAG